MKNKKSISFIELVTLYQNEGYTVKQLAKHFNVSETTIRRRLKECGVNFRKYNVKDSETEETISFTTINNEGYFCGGSDTFTITDRDIELLKEGKKLFSRQGINGGYEYGISLVYEDNN